LRQFAQQTLYIIGAAHKLATQGDDHVSRTQAGSF
jgi:hypothetical protein